MTMPKTAVDKDCRPVLQQEDIRGTGVSAVILAKSETPSVKSGAYEDFEFGIFPTNAGHSHRGRSGDRHLSR